MGEAADKLYVQMLGGFHLLWNGQEITLKFSTSTKAAQILQLLLYSAPDKVSSTSLISKMFSDENILSPSNNLKASVSLLRKQLVQIGLPNREYIKHYENGYRWCVDILPEVDALNFEKAAKSARCIKDKETRMKLCRAAIDLYTGDFLPELAGANWVMPINIYYGKLYCETVQALIDMLWEDAKYEEIISLADEANMRHRDDAWQTAKMQCLMKLSRWDDAKKVYMDVVTTMTREYDVAPSKELLEQYRIISSRIEGTLGTFDDMHSSIEEQEGIGGAYFCTFPGFIDSCRIVSRDMKRSGISCYLMLCSLCDSSGVALKSGDKLALSSSKLKEAIQKSLRRSDFFTQYNPSQYILFLFRTTLEHCPVIQERIENHFRSSLMRGVRLKFDLRNASDVDQQGFDFSGHGTWQ